MTKKAVTKVDLGTAVAAMPVIPNFNAPAVAKEIIFLNEQATRVLEGAQRADIKGAISASMGTDFLKAIGKRITEIDEKRKGVTGDFDKLVKGVNALFTKGPLFKLEQAKTAMQTKLGNFARAERVRLEAEAQVERERIAREAAAQATQAVAEGDTSGAIEILQGAASVQVVAEKVEVRGGAATLAGVKRKVGKVTSMRALMYWAATEKTPLAVALLGGVSVGQRELNQLAGAIFQLRQLQGDDSIGVPGFEASEEETFGAR